MEGMRTRVVRRRHRRARVVDRPTPMSDVPVTPQQRPTDPSDQRIPVGMRPYESPYDVSFGYAGDRPILLP
jgi:hypothetical protein